MKLDVLVLGVNRINFTTEQGEVIDGWKVIYTDLPDNSKLNLSESTGASVSEQWISGNQKTILSGISDLPAFYSAYGTIRKGKFSIKSFSNPQPLSLPPTSANFLKAS